MKPSGYNTQKLAAEAAAMEARLTALKLELQKDRAKREATAASASATQESIWSNGQQGPLSRRRAAGGSASSKVAATPAGALPRAPAACSTSRIPPRRAGTADTPTTHHPSPSNALPTGPMAGSARGRSPGTLPASGHNSRGPTAPSTRPTSTSSTSSSGSLDTRSSDTPTKAAAAKPRWLQQLKQQSNSGSFERCMPATTAPAASSGAAAITTSAGQCYVGADEDSSGAGSSQQEPSLLHGAYNEAAAAGSFQDALQEWRRAAPAGKPSRAGSSSSVGSSQQGPGLLQGAYDEAAAASSFQDALQEWRRAAPAGAPDCAGSTGACAGSSSGTETSQEQPSLLHGAYNEAEAASSFQDALRQWRQAGSSSNGGEVEAGASSAVGSGGVGTVRSVAATGQQCAQLQSSGTSTSTASGQGTSTKPINSSVAAFLQRLTTRSSPNPVATQDLAHRTITSLADSSSSMAAAVSTPHTDAADAVVPQGTFQDDTCDAADTSSETDGLADSDHVQEHSEPFDSFLQEAEQAAAMLLTTRQHNGGSCAQQGAGSSSSISGSGMAGGGSGVAASAAGKQQYHAQLAKMLQAVEQLEQQLQERIKPVRLA